MTAQNACDLLNEALRDDPAVVSALFCVKRTCNKAIADHPHIQVKGEEDGPFWLGFLGLLNGMLLASGSEDVVVVKLDDQANQNILSFFPKPYADFLPRP